MFGWHSFKENTLVNCPLESSMILRNGWNEEQELHQVPIFMMMSFSGMVIVACCKDGLVNLSLKQLLRSYLSQQVLLAEPVGIFSSTTAG